MYGKLSIGIAGTVGCGLMGTISKLEPCGCPSPDTPKPGGVMVAMARAGTSSLIV
jgi:hypothetical protein